MTEKLAIYKCLVCGIIVEVLDEGAGEMECCSQTMQKMEAQTEDSSREKHVPFMEEKDNGLNIRVGQNQAHPMEEKHFIQWIEVLADDGKAYRRFLKPGDKPEATFECLKEAGITAREYCNVHGLWQS